MGKDNNENMFQVAKSMSSKQRNKGGGLKLSDAISPVMIEETANLFLAVKAKHTGNKPIMSRCQRMINKLSSLYETYTGKKPVINIRKANTLLLYHPLKVVQYEKDLIEFRENEIMGANA